MSWIPYDYENKKECSTPEPHTLVWIFEEFYDGVTLGYMIYNSWHNWQGNDDVSVSHWMPLEYPEDPDE